MLKYEKIIPGQTPNLDWYKNLELPEGRTYRVTERIICALDSVNTTNSAGQEGNVVRSVGTDNVNQELIKNNMAVNGLLTSVQPGYVFNNDLYDGFTRFNSMLDLGWLEAIFNKLELKEGFTVEEMRDEIGLGANNHPPSKAATINDFKKRLNGYISSYKSEHNVLPSTGHCLDWRQTRDDFRRYRRSGRGVRCLGGRAWCRLSFSHRGSHGGDPDPDWMASTGKVHSAGSSSSDAWFCKWSSNSNMLSAVWPI